MNNITKAYHEQHDRCDDATDSQHATCAFTTCKRCGATHPRGTRCVLCADAKPKRPKRVKARSWQTPRGRVKNALRLLSLRCRERAEAMKRAGYACGRCGAKKSTAVGKEVRVEAHHCDPIAAENAMNRIIDMVFEYVLVPPERWEILCADCHKREHELEVTP